MSRGCRSTHVKHHRHRSCQFLYGIQGSLVHSTAHCLEHCVGDHRQWRTEDSLSRRAWNKALIQVSEPASMTHERCPCERHSQHQLYLEWKPTFEVVVKTCWGSYWSRKTPATVRTHVSKRSFQPEGLTAVRVASAASLRAQCTIQRSER